MADHQRIRHRSIPQQTIDSVAQEIRDYVAGRDTLAETVEGVANWWLRRQRFEDSLQVVHDALEILVAEGLLSKRVSGQQELYVKVVIGPDGSTTRIPQ